MHENISQRKPLNAECRRLFLFSMSHFFLRVGDLHSHHFPLLSGWFAPGICPVSLGSKRGTSSTILGASRQAMWTSHGHERVWWAPNSWELNWSNASLWWKWTLGKLWGAFFVFSRIVLYFFGCLTSGAHFVVVVVVVVVAVVVAAHSLREHGLGHSLREFNTGSPKRCHPKVQLHFLP